VILEELIKKRVLWLVALELKRADKPEILPKHIDLSQTWPKV